jgi:hypothetical protein
VKLPSAVKDQPVGQRFDFINHFKPVGVTVVLTLWGHAMGTFIVGERGIISGFANGGYRFKSRAAMTVKGGASAFRPQQIMHYRDDFSASVIIMRNALQRRQFIFAKRIKRKG